MYVLHSPLRESHLTKCIHHQDVDPHENLLLAINEEDRFSFLSKLTPVVLLSSA